MKASDTNMSLARHDTGEDDNRLTGLPYLEPDEHVKLRGARLNSVEELWSRLGDDFDRGVDRFAAELKINPARLSTSLIDELLGEMQFRNKPVPQRAWRWLRLHFLDIALVICLAVLAMLALRAAGFLSALPEPFGLKQKFLVAARNLEPGHPLKASDLYSARLPSDDDYFPDPLQLEGAITLKRVSRQKPLRRQDVSRLQVVAATDIPAGTPLDPRMVKLEWSPYDADAFLNTDQVLKRVANRPLRNGAVISQESTTQNAAPT